MDDFKIIREDDMLTFQNILKKYDMTVNEFYSVAFGYSYTTLKQVRFSKSEMQIVGDIADSLSLTFNAFVNICLRDYLDEHNDMIRKKDMLMYLDRRVKRERVNIELNNVIFAKRLNDLAVYYGVPVPSFIRYIVFKYIDDKYTLDETGNIMKRPVNIQ